MGAGWSGAGVLPNVAAVAVFSLFLLTLFLGMTLAKVFSEEGEWGKGYCCSVSWRETAHWKGCVVSQLYPREA